MRLTATGCVSYVSASSTGPYSSAYRTIPFTLIDNTRSAVSNWRVDIEFDLDTTHDERGYDAILADVVLTAQESCSTLQKDSFRRRIVGGLLYML